MSDDRKQTSFLPEDPTDQELREAWADQLEEMAQLMRDGEVDAYGVFLVLEDRDKILGKINGFGDVARMAVFAAIEAELEKIRRHQ